MLAPAFWLYAGEVAPDKAVRVPANAEVDQDGRLDASGYDVAGAAFVDWCIIVYTGVSYGDKMNR